MASTPTSPVGRSTQVEAQLKSKTDFTVVGKPHNRTDARDAVTGAKKFAMDLKVKGAEPTMICRPPTLNGKVKAIRNRAAVLKMPGVTHVVPISTGIAVPVRDETSTVIAALSVVRAVAAGAMAAADLTREDIAAVGITNQRETALVWDRETGKPIYNAIVWQDTRTDRIATALGGGA